MTPERYQQIDKVFQAALEREPHERAAFLDRACASDPSLRSEVEALIDSYNKAGSFIEAPVFEGAADLVANAQAGSLIGRQLGPYKITAVLGLGGMGEVYLAQDGRLGRKVALKLLPDYFTADEQRLRRFQQEARAESALNDPNIITILPTVQSFHRTVDGSPATTSCQSQTHNSASPLFRLPVASRAEFSTCQASPSANCVGRLTAMLLPTSTPDVASRTFGRSRPMADRRGS